MRDPSTAIHVEDVPAERPWSRVLRRGQTLRIVDLVAEGDKVVARFEAPGTHTGTFAGIPATGKTATWKGIVMYHVVGDKITEAWADWDDWGLVQQLQQK